ncbi:hypothetical protein ARMSODRAFT_1079659 [Armillaria solidipes]|uniref:Uncharacterized protein n=1 Tax=Armillaria solidipes TaxID=1076256 RepID=A0A2H3BWZ9_9AGAR|nr:hypothetical protein ARMSODRAFT_1079659 [Armillaria solidipes]
MQAIRRPLSSIFKAQKTVTYGLSTSRHAELPVPVHRQFTTFAPGSFRYASPAQNLRRVHVRTISYSSMPISIIREFRVPITVALIVAGAYWYANYKLQELRRRAQACLNDVQNTAIVMFNSAAYILKDVASRVSKFKFPDIPEAWRNNVQVIAINVFSSATDGLKAIRSRVPEAKTGLVKFVKKVFGGQKHKEGGGEGQGSEAERPQAPHNAVQDTVTSVLNSATNGLKDVKSRVPEAKTGLVKFVKNVFGRQKHKEGGGEGQGSEAERPQAPHNAVQDTVTNILNSATNGLKDVKSHVPEIKTGAVKFIKNVFGGQKHKSEGGGESKGSEGDQQSDKEPPTDAESEFVDKEDKPPSAQ